MSRRQKTPLRELTGEERSELEKLSRASSAPAAWVIRAKLLLAVAGGASYTEAAQGVGRKSGDAVSQLVERFNREGLQAIEPRHGGGPGVRYGSSERERVLAEVRRAPDREGDGTATWSLSTLQRTLRQAEDGLPQISTYTIYGILQAAGWSWQESRSWCETGQVIRKRKSGQVTVNDPDTEAKKA
jgi:transposase